ncbi:ion channel [Cupriavidus sp. CuC1]|uniref:ion channel n=1 Tax=Cupriavidus sp. CuC1 TaxID=3373131 RepID=UPI0037CEF0D4
MKMLSREWWRSVSHPIICFLADAVPYAKVALMVAVLGGPWAYGVYGAKALPVIGFGIVYGCSFSSQGRKGSIFGIIAVLYLGPVLVLMTPIVKTTHLSWLFSGVSGILSAMLYEAARAVAELDQKSWFRAGWRRRIKNAYRTRGWQLSAIPALYVAGFFQALPESMQTKNAFFLSFGAFVLGQFAGAFLTLFLPLDLRPAVLFYRAMRAGLISFALGYGLTIVLFAGFYAALYQFDHSYFRVAGSDRLNIGIWDFTYFSLTTITTIGLSDIKPDVGSFWPQALASAEILVGVFWVVVYFAVAMALLQAYVRDLVDKLGHAASAQGPDA